MDDFSKLSILDLDSTLEEEDLKAISCLSIDESDETCAKKTIPQQLLNKYMCHVPSSPSPLRKSVVVFEENDQMDVDVDADVDDDDYNDYNDSDDITSLSPVVNTESTPDNDLLEDDSDEYGGNENSSESGPETKAVIRALLSPTSLGIAAATKSDHGPRISELEVEKNITEAVDNEPTGITQTSMNDDDIQFLRQRSRDHPIQISINNHHYYCNPPLPVTPAMATTKDAYHLPSPWSMSSRPVSPFSYLFMSYLQLFLNALTVLVIFSVVTMLVRALKSDLKAAWHHAKLELDLESAQCELEYRANNCDPLTRVPYLESQCQDWAKCMNRNNDLLFRARTVISAQLFGDVINSFVEPLGWKTLLIVMIGMAIWCFSSNFILGFARAKSYYGEDGQQERGCKLREPSSLVSPRSILESCD
ncbi:LAMI_0D04214g1_1 [Lachancea mirantina]|uniref:LAMI_0D04214g1_1 n=1 Tax=Lachancea mirantina TaxID=1230905 RepID=A0A1G4JA78_9SACH|nr:LAMI_0D04214g1_1 [Lachancea mirantina]